MQKVRNNELFSQQDGAVAALYDALRVGYTTAQH